MTFQTVVHFSLYTPCDLYYLHGSLASSSLTDGPQLRGFGACVVGVYMWRKPDEGKPQSATDAQVSAASSPARTNAATPAPPVSSNAPACVSQGITIKGEIFGKEDLFIDGTIQGKIHFSDGSVTIGPNGRVNADIDAREIIIRGEVTGTLTARESVQIWSTGKLSGDMHTRGIVIEDGATLRGKVEVTQKEEPGKAARASDSRAASDAFARAVAATKSSES